MKLKLLSDLEKVDFYRQGGSVLYINPNKHKIICNSVKTSVIRVKMDIKIDILELSKTFNNILEDSRPF